MAAVAYGIDLGTSRTKIASLEAGREPQAIDIDGTPLVPSVVWFDDRPGQEPVKVGLRALEKREEFPSRVVSSVKRQMGKSPAELKDPQSGDARLPLAFQGRQYGPVEISAEILKHVVEGARRKGHQPREVVVTVPAEFDFRQREATVNAVREAGLDLRMLLSEPVAALLADVLLRGDDLSQAQNLTTLVFDLGGGTLDCTIIHVANGENRVLAKTGGLDNAGDKIDDIIFEHIALGLSGQHKIVLEGDDQVMKRARQRVLTECRKAKETLSENANAPISLLNLQLATRTISRLDTALAQDSFQTLITPLVNTYQTHIRRALSEASLSPGEVDRVLVVGGSGRIPLVRRMVESVFEAKKVHLAEKPDLFVAFGAATAAWSLQNGKAVIFDTLRRALGMQDSGSMRFVPLLPRGTNLAQAEISQSARWPAGTASVALNLYEAEDKARNIDDRDANGPLCNYVGTWEFAPSAPPNADTPFKFSIACDPATSLLDVSGRLEGMGNLGGKLEVKRHNTPLLVQGVEAQRQAQLDLMVLLDTTGSLRHGAGWSALKGDLRSLLLRFWDEAAGSGAGKVNLRAGLTTFGDLRESALARGDALNVFDFTPRQRDFLNYLARVDDFATEGGDDPESCLDALRKAAGSGLRSDDSTLRAFVLITDGSEPAEPVGVRTEQIVRELRERDVVVYCIAPYSQRYADLAEGSGGLCCEIDDGPMRDHLRVVLHDIHQKTQALAANA